jgi:hypothetical protein
MDGLDWNGASSSRSKGVKLLALLKGSQLLILYTKEVRVVDLVCVVVLWGIGVWAFVS